MPEPSPEEGPILVLETQAIGVCGTDLEIINGDYGVGTNHAQRLVPVDEPLLPGGCPPVVTVDDLQVGAVADADRLGLDQDGSLVCRWLGMPVSPTEPGCPGMTVMAGLASP